MKQLILKKIKISNFRGRNIEVEFGEKQTRISGRNGIGKSTIFYSWAWLLTGWTDPYNVKNANLFDNRVPLSPDTPTASVLAEISLDGYDYTLERQAIAKFVRNRSTNEWEKSSSDEYRFFIDGVEMSAQGYTSWLESNICPIANMQFLVSGEFFAALVEDDKKRAREVLEGICGEVRPEDFKGDYSVIEEDMKRFPISVIEDRIKAEMKPLKARMAEIPAIIDSKQVTLAEYEQIDYDSLLKEIESKKADIEQIDASILGQGKAIEPIMGERNRIYDLINDKSMMLYEAKIAHNNRETAKISAVKSQLDEAKRKNASVARENEMAKANFDAICREVESQKRNLKMFEDMRNELLEQRDEIKARVFSEVTCSYCGQELPYDKQEEMRQVFNERKQKELELIVAKGRKNNESISVTKETIAKLEELIAKGYTTLEVQDLSALEEQYRVAQTAFVPFESTSEYARLSKEIDDLKATLPEIPTNDNEALTNAKRMLIGELETLNRRYGLKSKADAIRLEIEMHRNEQRTIGSEIARLEGKIDKCKEYAQEKADIISFRVNGKLNDCKIEMWSTLKSGEVVGDCVILNKDGVKVSSTNGADKGLISIDLQKLFMRRYNVCLPIFLDEASIYDDSHLPYNEEYQSIYFFASNSMYLEVS